LSMWNVAGLLTWSLIFKHIGCVPSRVKLLSYTRGRRWVDNAHTDWDGGWGSLGTFSLSLPIVV
jgi:hypothetical protein